MKLKNVEFNKKEIDLRSGFYKDHAAYLKISYTSQLIP